MPAGLGHIPAALHGAPAALAGTRAVVEPRAARVRGADAKSPALLSAEHLRSVIGDEPQGVTGGIVGGGPSERRGAQVVQGEVRWELRERQPSVDDDDRRLRDGASAQVRLNACVDRFAQLVGGEQERRRHRRRLRDQLGLGEPTGEIGGCDEGFHVPQPPLPPGVNEVQRWPSAQPVPPRGAALKRQFQIFREVHNPIVAT